jgi:hypothetical protein
MTYIYGAVGAIFGFLLLSLWFYHRENAHLRSDNLALHMQVIQATAANKDQATTISMQAKSLQAFKDLADEHTKQMAQAVQAVHQAQVERDKATAHMLELDAQDAARRECKAVLDQDISLACPAIAADMVERAKE